MYSLVGRGSSLETKNFASLYVAVPMEDNTGVKDGRPSVTFFLTLAELYIIPGFEPEALKSLYCSKASINELICVLPFVRKKSLQLITHFVSSFRKELKVLLT